MSHKKIELLAVILLFWIHFIIVVPCFSQDDEYFNELATRLPHPPLDDYEKLTYDSSEITFAGKSSDKIRILDTVITGDGGVVLLLKVGEQLYFQPYNSSLEVQESREIVIDPDRFAIAFPLQLLSADTKFYAFFKGPQPFIMVFSNDFQLEETILDTTGLTQVIYSNGFFCGRSPQTIPNPSLVWSSLGGAFDKKGKRVASTELPTGDFPEEFMQRSDFVILMNADGELEIVSKHLPYLYRSGEWINYSQVFNGRLSSMVELYTNTSMLRMERFSPWYPLVSDVVKIDDKYWFLTFPTKRFENHEKPSVEVVCTDSELSVLERYYYPVKQDDPTFNGFVYDLAVVGNMPVVVIIRPRNPMALFKFEVK